MRQPSSLLLWMIVITVVAAASEALRGFGAWTRGEIARGPGWTPSRTAGEPFTGRAYIIDGDTLDVAGERVRLFGIDAPERYQDCRDGRGQDYVCGRAAARALGRLVGGRAITCTPVQHDRYDRDVAMCTVEGRDLSDAMVRAGQAIELAQYSRGRYGAAEREARIARRGLWAGTFEFPADWRRRHGR